VFCTPGPTPQVLGIPQPRYCVPLVVAIGYSKPVTVGGGSFRSARYPLHDVVRVDGFEGPGYLGTPPPAPATK